MRDEAKLFWSLFEAFGLIIYYLWYKLYANSLKGREQG